MTTPVNATRVAGAAMGAQNIPWGTTVPTEGVGKWIASVLGGGSKVAATAEGSMGPKLANMAGGNWVWLLPIILGWYLSRRQSAYYGRQETEMQTEHVRKSKEALDPEDLMYQAMMPEMGQQNQMAQMILMQQMMGGQMPQLATGEERIGGRQQPSQSPQF